MRAREVGLILLIAAAALGLPSLGLAQVATQPATPSRPAPVPATATAAAPSQAQAAVAAPRGKAIGDGSVIDMDTVVVSGRQPGPGMWKVSKGGHVLYILGTLSPLPRGMEWVSTDVENAIAQSQAVIDPPTVKLDTDVGFFGKLFLLPALLKARKNPDGRTLQDVVPADLYARWQVLKPRYIGSDGGVENWRPIFAAQELYESAMRKSGLSQKNVVGNAVNAAAKKHGVPHVVTETRFRVSDPKAAIREFNNTALADTDCFAKTMVRIEGDLDSMKSRANAWAVGDIAALRDMSLEDQYVACTRAIIDSGLAQKLGLGDVRAKIAGTWMAATESALAKNQVSFATLSIPLLLRSDGFLARLRAQGYTVEEPE